MFKKIISDRKPVYYLVYLFVSPPMHILIAPNSFKNSIDAKAATDAITEGLLQSNLACTCEGFPVADGGDGTASLLIERLNGTVVPTKVHDPFGRKITSSFGFIDEG